MLTDKSHCLFFLSSSFPAKMIGIFTGNYTNEKLHFILLYSNLLASAFLW